MLAEALDAVETLEVSDVVLGHGVFPFVDAGEKRCGAEAENLLQFVANDGDDGVMGELPDIFGVRSGEEATQEGAVSGSTVRELVVNEGRG